MGYRIEIFNVGNFRRRVLGAGQTHDFFDPRNRDGEAARRLVAQMAFDEMAAALRSEAVDVAIFDATHTTVARRRWLAEALRAVDAGFKLVFVESICTDEAVIRANVCAWRWWIWPNSLVKPPTPACVV
jgi:hypothetical protein